MKYILLCLGLMLAGCATKPPEIVHKRELSISGDSYQLDGQDIPLENISKVLSSSDQVVLRVSQTAAHERVQFVMDECAEAEVKIISFRMAP